MSILDTITGIGIKETLDGIGSLATSIRAAITGDNPLTAEQRADLERKTIELHKLIADISAKIDRIKGDIIIAEAKGDSWLQRNWRPMLMCAFGFIVVNNYIISPYLQALFGFSVHLDLPPAMWDLLKIGVGGYIVGRSVEKGIERWKSA